jgi:hypothetical protein
LRSSATSSSVQSTSVTSSRGTNTTVELVSGVGEFFREKGAHKLTTRYGLQYSPHYAQQSIKNREG